MIISKLSELQQGEVALLRVDPETGVPVDKRGDWVRAGREHYLKFESETEARAYTTSQLKNNPLLEWSLVDSMGNQLAIIHNKKALLEATAQKERPI